MAESEYTKEQFDIAKTILKKCGVEGGERWSMDDFEEAIIDALSEDESVLEELTEEEIDLLIKLGIVDDVEEDEELDEELEEDAEEEVEEEEAEEEPEEEKEKKPKRSRENSVKQVFKRVILSATYPISIEDVIAEVKEGYGDDANEDTIRSYISWAKRKKNPFGISLKDADDDKLDKQDLEE